MKSLLFKATNKSFFLVQSVGIQLALPLPRAILPSKAPPIKDTLCTPRSVCLSFFGLWVPRTWRWDCPHYRVACFLYSKVTAMLILNYLELCANQHRAEYLWKPTHSRYLQPLQLLTQAHGLFHTHPSSLDQTRPLCCLQMPGLSLNSSLHGHLFSPSPQNLS